MVEFLIKNDLHNASFMNPDGTYLIKEPMLSRMFDETNEWYTEMALEYGVSEDDIAVFVQPNQENRSSKMKRLAKLYMKVIIFSSIKDEVNLTIARQDFKELRSTVNYYELVGETPSNYTEQSEFGTVAIEWC